MVLEATWSLASQVLLEEIMLLATSIRVARDNKPNQVLDQLWSVPRALCLLL